MIGSVRGWERLEGRYGGGWQNNLSWLFRVAYQVSSMVPAVNRPP